MKNKKKKFRWKDLTIETQDKAVYLIIFTIFMLFINGGWFTALLFWLDYIFLIIPDDLENHGNKFDKK